jgi:hypothetical protein
MAGAVLTAAPASAATADVATWQLNEPAGASTMHDSSGNGHDGDVGDEVDTGVTFDGATGYRFERLTPNTPPARPEHNVVVRHSASLNPNTGAYSVEVRYRTDNPFGNLIQKGQATTRGGYWKIQLPLGEPNCLFRGPTGVTNAVRRNIAVDDNKWHIIRCDRTDDAVELFVDGVLAGRNTGTTGSIANDLPLSLGGRTTATRSRRPATTSAATWTGCGSPDPRRRTARRRRRSSPGARSSGAPSTAPARPTRTAPSRRTRGASVTARPSCAPRRPSPRTCTRPLGPTASS